MMLYVFSLPLEVRNCFPFMADLLFEPEEYPYSKVRVSTQHPQQKRS